MNGFEKLQAYQQNQTAQQFQSLADQIQQQQQNKPQPQGPTQSGAPMQPQTDPLQNFQMMAAKLASVNPSAYGAQATAAQNPLAIASSMLDNRVKAAQSANDLAEAQARSVHPLPNGQMLVMHPDGSHEILGPAMPQSEEGKKIHDLMALQ